MLTRGTGEDGLIPFHHYFTKPNPCNVNCILVSQNEALFCCRQRRALKMDENTSLIYFTRCHRALPGQDLQLLLNKTSRAVGAMHD